MLPPLLNIEILLRNHYLFSHSYSLLLKLKKTKDNILAFTLHCFSPSNTAFASDLCLIHISVRGYKNMISVMLT